MMWLYHKGVHKTQLPLTLFLNNPHVRTQMQHCQQSSCSGRVTKTITIPDDRDLMLRIYLHVLHSAAASATVLSRTTLLLLFVVTCVNIQHCSDNLYYIATGSMLFFLSLYLVAATLIQDGCKSLCPLPFSAE